MKPSVTPLLNDSKDESSILSHMPTDYPSIAPYLMTIPGPSIFPIQQPSNKLPNLQ